MTHTSPINKVIFIGTPDFAVPTLKKLSETKYRPLLVITQPDKPQGRKLKLVAPPVKKKARELGIDVIQPENIRQDDVFFRLRDIEPDVIITAAYGGFLNKRILRLPQYGCLNIHPSLLPKYRGATPVNHALFQGEKETGITITRMTMKMDSGPILRQKTVPIDEKDNYSSLSARLAFLGAVEMIEVLKSLEKNTVYPVAQNGEEATYCYKLKKEDLLLNWNDSAENIHNRVRGLADEPGAVTTFRGKKIKILETERLEETAEQTPGNISSIRKNKGIVVCCNDKRILLTKVQPSGKRIMTAYQFSIGARIKNEECFVSGADH